MKSISSRLKERSIVVLDGAMGTELFRRGIQTPLPSWSASALLENSKMVQKIHEDYLNAGAEIITTNTFRTTSRALKKVGMGNRAKELTQLAVNLARDAADHFTDKPVWIAGSVAPLEDCYEPALIPDSATAFSEHSELIGWLVEAGVDLILIETMNSIQEADAAARAARNSNVPMFISWTCVSEGNILNGESIHTAVRLLERYHPAAFLVNCTPSKNIEAALQKMHAASRVPIGAYANIGKPEPIFGWELNDDQSPMDYAAAARGWIREGAKIVGGCCGTTPEHIFQLKQFLEKRSSR